MKACLALFIAIPLWAQQSAPAAPDQQPAPSSPTAAADQQTPVPATHDNTLSATVDVGYRWWSGAGGSLDAYRSIVNLGSGPKLFNLDLSFESAARKWVDRMNLRANGWGDEPYTTAHFDATRHDWYNFNADYRNIAYFNFLPTFADPTAVNGVYLNQNSFDTHQRDLDFELDLLPGKWIVPYLAYSHNSEFGRGITDFVSDANSYAVTNLPRDRTDNYRGGVRIELRRLHVTLEQGGTTFKDDQQVYTNNPNLGNFTRPFLGEQLYLMSLNQAYGIRGDSIYSKVLVTASPTSWLDVFGQFLYSRPDTDVNYAQYNAGQFVNLETLLFFNSELELLNAAAKQPHTSGNLGFELRPTRRLRVIESWMTDRLHDASSAALSTQVLTPAMAAELTDFTDRLVRNYSQEQVDALVDVTHGLTLRGGYRYVWGDALTSGALISGVPFETSEVRRHVGLAGASYRLGQKLLFNLDFEGSSGDLAYFRTSLMDYRRARIRARYQATNTLLLSAAFSVFSNQNPAPSINYDFLSRDNSISVLWNPRGGKRLTFSGEYTRATVRSNINYIVPQDFTTALSIYRDNAHEATAYADLLLPGFGGNPPHLSLGGAMFISSGSRPTEYYQPLVKFTTPSYKHVAWYGEWRWYGFGEPFYTFEGFRANLLTVGMRYTR